MGFSFTYVVVEIVLGCVRVKLRTNRDLGKIEKSKTGIKNRFQDRKGGARNTGVRRMVYFNYKKVF